MEIGLESMKQTIFQMPETIFLSHGIGMPLFYCFQNPFYMEYKGLNLFTVPLCNSVELLYQGIKRLQTHITI